MVIPYSKRLFAHPHSQTSALNERGIILAPVARAVSGFESLPSPALRLTNSPPAQLFVQQSPQLLHVGRIDVVIGKAAKSMILRKTYKSPEVCSKRMGLIARPL